MIERNERGVNLKIELLAEKLLEAASEAGATAHEFWLACEKAERMIGEKQQLLLVKDICGK